MMNVAHFIRASSTLLLILVGMISCLFAHETGTIRGRITDAETGDGLVGVNIVISGTVLGASSGLDGRFTITGVPQGSHTVRISYLGYTGVEKDVIVKSDEEASIEVQLEPGAIDLSEVLIEAERAYSAASSRAVRQFDLRVRPSRSAQDMLQLAPGLIIAQHGGGGKAEQIFMRGFDGDHGTDVAIFTDGIPVNMVTHGHGQGYADLHFLIPEIVESIEVFKGPYFARFGNLSTAGSVTFKTRDHLEQNLVSLVAGEFNSAKLTAAFQIPTGGEHQNIYFAGQFYKTDGPFESPQDFQRFNIFGKFHMHLSRDSRLGFSLGAFSSGWNQSGQIPQRAVDDGTITRFGAINEAEGGVTSRQNLTLTYEVGLGSADEFSIQGYISRYNFKLFSDFTFFLKDSLLGDMFEQTDSRNIGGFNTRYKFRRMLGSVLSSTTVGGGFRADNIKVGLWKSPERIRLFPNSNAEVFERNFFLWVEQEFVFNTQWRMQFGLRGDYFTFNVDDKLDTQENNHSKLPRASGYHQKSILNPKVNLVFSPWSSSDFFVNAGSGYHSNDARNVVIARRINELEQSLWRQGFSDQEIDEFLRENNFDPEQRNIETLPRAIGAELGLRTHITRQFLLGLAVWWLNLEEELVFVGDEGTTEISGETQRIGLDIEVRFQFTSWLWADADVNISNGKFVNEPEGANKIPLAPQLTSTGGLTAITPGNRGWEGTFRYRHVGDRPANEFNTVTALGYTIYNLSLGYRFGNIKVFASVENILDSDWNEAQFDTESRLYNEPESVSEIHFTPGNPRNFQVGVSYLF